MELHHFCTSHGMVPVSLIEWNIIEFFLFIGRYTNVHWTGLHEDIGEYAKGDNAENWKHDLKTR